MCSQNSLLDLFQFPGLASGIDKQHLVDLVDLVDRLSISSLNVTYSG